MNASFSKNEIYLVAILVVSVFAFSFFYFYSDSTEIANETTQIVLPNQKLESEPVDLQAKFVLLSGARTNYCAGPDILEKTTADRLQGSCCSAMDFHRYEEQVEGLKKYAYIEKIPSDPYDIQVSMAEELLNYQKTISLSASQQSVYDEAVKISHEGGPCCCKCWRWYAFEGLAKYLITEHNFNAEQIAEVWDLEDGCGGTGHVDGMHI